jgi:acetylglutamate kinase
VDPQLQAEILNQALPYIQAFRGQTFVVKYGGSAMREPQLMRGVIRNVLLLQLVGIKPILVHGGGPEIDRWLSRLGIEKRTVDGLRVTDEETMEIVEMVLGRANKALVAEIGEAGGKAIGLSGRDGRLLMANPMSPELGRVGEVAEVHPEVLDVASNAGQIPDVSAVAQSADGGPLNVNADSAAAAIAARLHASKLVLLTDTDGVLQDKNDPATRLSTLDPTAARKMIDTGQADKGMIPKLQAAIDAVEEGVRAVHLINGSTPNALLIEVFTDLGIGTMLVQR